MTSRSPRFLPALASAGLAVLLLASCSSNAEPASTETAPVSTAPSTAPTEAQPDPSETPDAGAAATCESILDPEIVTDFGTRNWTYKVTTLTAGGVTLDDGLQCTWADYTVASGNLMIFGWGALTSDEATAMQDGLVGEGWLREEADGTVYITEDPMQAPTVDENGYGMTYEFGDGWVTVADTKQNLLLITRPAA